MKELITRGAYALKRFGWRRMLRRYRKDLKKPLESGRVLVRMDAGIGNAVEATPLVQAIRAVWPRTHLTILPPPGDLFDDWNVVDRVATADEIAGERFHHTFITWFAERETAGFTPGRVFAIPPPFADYPTRPEREFNLDPLREIAFGGATPPLYVGLREPRAPLPEATCRIALAPGGKTEHRWRNKRWPHFRALIDRLRETRPETQVLVIGGPGDDLGGTLPEDVVDLRGLHTLRETAWTLKQCDLVIGNDCGPTHVADAVLTPTLVLFGPTCEIKNGPRNRGATLTNDVACRPCQYDLELLDRCDNPICLSELKVERVLAQVEQMIGAERPAPALSPSA